MSASEIYIMSAAKTLAVQTGSVGWVAADMVPTTGPNQGRTAEMVMINAVGALYVEFGGVDATTGSFPMAAGDTLTINGYQNIRDMRLIRNTSNTTAVAVFGYR